MVGIYKITNTKNGKVYIGQSINIAERWKAHRHRPFNPNSNQYDSMFYRAIRKYGIEQFTFEVLEECNKNDLDIKEQYYIQLYNSNNAQYGYNSTVGGKDGTPSQQILNSQQVNEIYELLQNTRISEENIAQKFYVSQRLISGINLGQYYIKTGYKYPLRTRRIIHYCIDCGVEITSTATRCVSCANLLRPSSKPERDILKQEIRAMSFTELGKKYKVSDTAVKKWCKTYNLPHKKSDIKLYSDEEWSKL